MQLLFAVIALASGAEGFPSLFSKHTSNATLLTDLSIISRSWGQVSPYMDNTDSYFGVNDVGIPDGCAIEQVHSLQRHGQRFPTSSYDDGGNDEHFGAKLFNFTSPKGSASFTGQLAFLNSYQY